jgi:hypothetical protein
MTPRYPWKRFWVPREGRIVLDEAGYLRDPDNEWGRLENPDVAASADIDRFAALVLLGEPGSGKTYAIQEAVDAARSRGLATIQLELGAYPTETTLIRDLWECPEYQHHLETKSPLYLFLDALDEGLLGVRMLAGVLAREFRRYPADGLFLRITCRTAAWPSTLEEFLKEHWGESSLGVHELAPLREQDVATAALVEWLDPDAFLNEVARREASALASRPLTLRFLLNIYRREKSFPSTRAELYRRGCLQLCEEANQMRRDAGYLGEYTAAQRFVTAARLAAAMLFGNRSAIWTGSDLGKVPLGDVRLAELATGEEAVEDHPFDVTENALREALDTGLFSSRGLHRMGFAHQTYAEYLAARYLHTHDVRAEQAVTLLRHPDDPERKLVPQLYEVASWLAGMDISAFDRILEIDAPVLLRSDIGIVEPGRRAALVSRILGLADLGDWADVDWGLWGHYQKLSHPDLSSQLLLWIQDRRKGLVARRTAIDIATACGLASISTVRGSANNHVARRSGG